jgi:hypothetical protein
MIHIFFGLLTALFGWAGGRGNDYCKAKRYPCWMFQSWVRDWLIATLCPLIAYLLGVHSWWLILSIPLIGGALSTYWDELFGFDNFWFHGFMVGIAVLPIVFVTHTWGMFALRSLLLAIWMGGWSLFISNDHLEEAGRYFPIGATMFLIC